MFVVQQAPHLHFIRQGDDLTVTVGIGLAQALGGGTVDVPTLDGRILRVPLKEVVTPGYERLVKNEGMPVSRRPGSKGDLRLRFEVRYPTKQLSEAERGQLEAMLRGKT